MQLTRYEIVHQVPVSIHHCKLIITRLHSYLMSRQQWFYAHLDMPSPTSNNTKNATMNEANVLPILKFVKKKNC
eukprot:4851139-Ditylum_brightwellii.AAC.1